MSWLFGKGKKKEKKQEVPTIEQNSENLSKTIEDLNKKINYQEQLYQEETRKAIAFKKQGNDKKAKDCLKKRKMIEIQTQKFTQMKDNLENQQAQIQGAEMTSKVFAAYVQNNEVMKNQFKGYDIDKIQDTLDEMADNQESFNEITDAIASTNFGPQVDEDELDDEFANLDADVEPADANPGYAAPAAPMANAAPAPKDEEEIDGLMAGFS